MVLIGQETASCYYGEAKGEAALTQASRSVATTQAIYEYIRKNRLRLGDSLPSEVEFANLLGVSRGIVREALKGLEALNVISSGNGRRAKVGGIDPNALAILIDHAIHTSQVTIQQVLDVRRAIELRTVALAAIRRTDEEAGTICAIADAMLEKLDDRSALTQLDLSFHRALGAASRNPMHDLFIGSFSAVMNESGPIGWQTQPREEDLEEIIRKHGAIAAAVSKQDVEMAELEMDQHFDLTVKALIASGYS